MVRPYGLPLASSRHKSFGRWATLVLLLSAGSASEAADPFFDAKGFQPNRELFSELPFEHIDPMTGNLLLTFTDLVLPGNAGFDLRIQRTYNSKIYATYTNLGGYTLGEDSWAGLGWTLHLGRVLDPNNPNSAPIIEMPDGSRHQLYHHMDGNPNHYITKDYWTYDNVFQFPVLRLPNGLKYTFGHSRVPAGPFYVTQIEDPFGNKLVVSYEPLPAPADVIASVQQQLAGGQTRTVTFTYTDTMPTPQGPQSVGSLATMVFNGRTWTYTQQLTNPISTYTQLMEVKPPVGPSWTFEYEDTDPLTPFMLTHLETPNGGELDYTYKPQIFYIGSSFLFSPVVTKRQTSGRDVPAGTWDYKYSSSSAQNETEITTPCGSKTTYSFLGIGPNANQDPWAIGALDKRITTDGTGVFETEDLTWIASVPISNVPDPPLFTTHVALLGRRDVTRSGRTYSTSYTYSPHPYDPSLPDNFNDYGRASNIAETGDLARTTSRAFFYGSSSDPSFGTYIVDKLASDTVLVGNGAFTRSYTYDAANGFKTSETTYGITTAFTPDSSGSGNVRRSTDANNNSTTYSYTWGVPSQIQTPEYTISRTINDDSTIASETRRGFTISFLYDLLSRPTRTTPPVGTPIVTSYDNTAGTFVKVTRGASELTTTLDGFGRASAASNTVGIKTDVTYDACGRRIFESYPFVGNTPTGTTYTYDPLGRVTRRTHPNGDFIAYTYPLGVDVDITDEEQRLTREDWSAFGDPAGDARLVQVTDAKGVTTGHNFNALGSLTSVTLPGGSPTRAWTYNSRNELVTETHPENGSTTYTYDPAGNLKTRTDPQFGTTTFSYDRNDRLTGIDRPASAYDTAIGYDASGNRTALVTADVSSGFAYDSANRLVSREDDLDGAVLQTGYAYDPNDNLSRLTYPSGAKVDYSYDSENRITRVANGVGATYADQFSYHPSGAPTSYRAGNNLLHQFTYDTRYRLRTLNAGGGSRLRLTYTYDRVSNVTRVDDARGAQFSYSNLQYDTLDRLRQVTGAFGAPSFDYDAKGNRLFKQVGTARTDYNYDAASQLLLTATGAEPDSFNYDLNGNTIANDAGSYTYTPTNMLASSSLVGGSPTSYIYDGDDLRKVKIAATGISYYVHGPGGQLLGEYQNNAGALTVVRDYVLAGTRLIAEVSPSVLTATPQTLSFLAVLNRPPPSPQNVALASSGGSLPWNSTVSVPWLRATPASGTSTPATLTVSVDASGLTPGSYTGSVTITASGAVNSPVVVSVQLTVFQTASLYLSPAALSFYRPAGGPDPQAQTISILFPGEPVLWQAAPVDWWISVSPPPSGTTPGTLSVSVSGQGLPPGTHRGNVTVTSPGTPGSPQTLSVELVIGPAPGQLCAPDASYCEIFDDEPLGNLAAGWIWSEPNVPQVVTDPRGSGNVMLLDPPAGNRLNGDVNLASPHAISGTEISVQIMTTGTNPNIPLSLAKIEFYTQPGRGWAKTTRTFGTLRFGSTLRFQGNPTQTQMLVNPMQPGRWYAVRVRYEGGQAEVYVDGDLKFTTAAPDADLQLEAYSLTAWDFAPGAAYVDVLESRPGELVVDPMSLELEATPGGGCPPEPSIAASGKSAPLKARTPSTSAPGVGQAAPRTSAINIPVAFEPNMGQADSSVEFLARARGHLLLVRSADIILALPEPRQHHARMDGQETSPTPGRSRKSGRRHALVRMKLGGSESPFQFEPQETLPSFSHHFVGDDPSRWRTHVPHYASVVARDVYPGIDFVLRDQEGRAEYDLVVNPAADPAVIDLRFEGTRRMHVDSRGDLVLETALGQELRQPRPNVYQEGGGVRRPVTGAFKLTGRDRVGFEIGPYDPSLPLVIDPVIVWSASLGGSSDDGITALTVDASGSVYVTGSTGSSNFPLAGPFQPVKDFATDAFVSKLLPDGTGLVYSSFLGGSGADDEGRSIAVDSSGRALVVGRIGLTGFPPQNGSFPIVNAAPIGPQGSYDLFVAKVEADGSQLVYSTRIGGSLGDVASDVALDGSGVAHVVGYTTSLDFPLMNPYQSARAGYQDAFVLSLSQSGSQPPQMAYSTYLGGTDATGSGLNRFTSAAGAAVDSAGNAYVAGETNAEQFTAQFACIPDGPFVGSHAFVARLSTGQLTNLRCFGGSGIVVQNGDAANDVAVAANGSVWLGGDTVSPDFPAINAPFPFGGGTDAFVTAFSSDLSSMTFSTPFGSSAGESVTGVAIDPNGQIVATGTTFSRELPVVAPLQGCPSSYLAGNPGDSFLLELDPVAAQAVYATYLPGSPAGHLARSTAVGADGSVYVGGATLSAVGFGVSDGFVTKIQDGIATPDPGTITLNNAVGGPAMNTSEDAGVFGFSVERLGGGAGTVTADVATSDGTATAGADYDPLAVTAVFAENQCHADYEVLIFDDTQPESDETFDISLSNVTGGALLGPISLVTVTILDNDCGGGGGSAQGSFVISHRTQPVGPTWQASVDVPWLTLDAYSGIGPATVTATADPTGLADGTYVGRITVTATDATGSPQDVLVSFVVSSQVQ